MKSISRARLLALGALAALAAACSAGGGPGPAGQLGSASPPVKLAPGDPVADLQSAYVQVAKAVQPSVVLIETDRGLGSGVIYDTAGNVVTNDHVVAGASQFRVTLADGRQESASRVGEFPPDDLAVIRLSNASNVHPASFGKSSNLQVGDIVMAIGNPLGLQSSVTSGIVSALGRQVQEGGGITIPDAIQTSAPINPGNSGGALVDLQGQVVGIPTAAATDPQLGGTAPGIGFAISSDMATNIAGQLVKSGTVTNSGRAYLGINVAQTLGGRGLLVAGVQANGPAAKAGITQGDLITSVNGQPVPTVSQLGSVLAAQSPGKQVTVHVVRPDGSQADVKVTLGELPGSGS
jgi:putative serine protease PepD